MNWINLQTSVQADLRSSLGDAGYIVFGVILFVWELLPTSLVVYFFRVRRPPQDRVSFCGLLSGCVLRGSELFAVVYYHV